MSLFESYERRIGQITPVLSKYGISSLEEAKEICAKKGFDPYTIAKGIQPICFENAGWAYVLGAAIAVKKGCKKAADAAEAASLSPNYLTHLIKKETGKTFTELLTERRLALAQELLLATGERIGEIARRCGFADEAYFARRFRQWHGLSPRAWRERQRQALG